jgi:hypothetical protein
MCVCVFFFCCCSCCCHCCCCCCYDATYGQNLMRSMTRAELAAAQWSIIDFGSAARLLPPASQAAVGMAAAAAAAGPAASSSTQSGLLAGLFAWINGSSSRSASASATASSMRWEVEPGLLVPYETPAYTPPEVSYMHVTDTCKMTFMFCHNHRITCSSATACAASAGSKRITTSVEQTTHRLRGCRRCSPPLVEHTASLAVVPVVIC